MSRLLAWHFSWLACSPRWCISRPDNLKIHILYDIVVKCQNLVNLITSIELYPLKPVWWLLHFRGPRITVQKVVCSCCWKCQSTNCAFLFSCLRSDRGHCVQLQILRNMGACVLVCPAIWGHPFHGGCLICPANQGHLFISSLICPASWGHLFISGLICPANRGHLFMEEGLIVQQFGVTLLFMEESLICPANWGHL